MIPRRINSPTASAAPSTIIAIFPAMRGLAISKGARNPHAIGMSASE